MSKQDYSSHIEKAQAAILKKIAEDGLLHSLTFSDNFFRKAAQAFIADEIEAVIGKAGARLSPLKRAEAKEAAALVVCLPYVRQISSSLSTSQGQNLLKLALAEAAAEALRESSFLLDAVDRAHAKLATLRTADSKPATVA